MELFVTALGDYQHWFALPAEGFANNTRKDKNRVRQESKGRSEASLRSVLGNDLHGLGGQSELKWN